MENPFMTIKKKQNLTYQELGRIFGVSRQCIHQLAHNTTAPSGKIMLLLIMMYNSYFTPLELYNYYYASNNNFQE